MAAYHKVVALTEKWTQNFIYNKNDVSKLENGSETF